MKCVCKLSLALLGLAGAMSWFQVEIDPDH